MRHTVRVNQRLSALEVDLADFTADVAVVWLPASGDGFDEPREPPHAEYDGVKQIDGPHIAPEDLSKWAAEWVDAHQDQIADECQPF